eukprot:gene17627-19381_t
MAAVQILTTVVGSMPKPSYLQVPGWYVNGKYDDDYIEKHNIAAKKFSENDVQDEIFRATREVLELQQQAGIDVVTDGELRRDSYVHAFCRHLNGIDFENLKSVLCRNGAAETKVPQIVSHVSPKDQPGWLAADWKLSQSMTKNQVKVTVPGPMTIIDTTCNSFYKDELDLYKALVECINNELKYLAAAGCRQIQVLQWPAAVRGPSGTRDFANQEIKIDEPVLMRYPDKALEYGIDFVSQCFHGIPDDVFKTVHACCGYPQYLDQTDYEKADKDAYLKVATAIDNSNIDAFSLEDTHRRNDPKLFSMFKKIKVILGVIDVVKSRLETVEEVRAHIQDVLKYIPAERLMVAPDCGLIFLPMELAEKKLKNMVEAAKSI